MRVLRPFRWVRFSSGDDTNDVLFFKVAMADDQDVKLDTNTEENEAIFQVRVLWVGYHPSRVIEERRPGFIKRDALLLLVRRVFYRVLFEADIVHTYSVLTT